MLTATANSRELTLAYHGKHDERNTGDVVREMLARRNTQSANTKFVQMPFRGSYDLLQEADLSYFSSPFDLSSSTH
jgi:hypothetical protein